MTIRLLRSVVVSLLALVSTKIVLDSAGLGESVEQQAARWLIPLYIPWLNVLLFSMLVVYFSCHRPQSTWGQDAVIGLAAGSLAGPLAIVAAGLMESGVEGILRGFRDAGVLYVFVLIGPSFYPLVSWLYGGIAAVSGGLLERHLIRHIERRLGLSSGGAEQNGSQ